MLHDAHFHCEHSSFLKHMKANEISGIVNIQNPLQYTKLKQYITDSNGIWMSAGIHPWDVNTVRWEDLLPIMEKATVIGEVGMDNVWCQSDIHTQTEILNRSLRYACAHHKPVILHTKGMERKVLSYIKRYPNTYLVHWYSCENYIQNYMEYGCYFTVGPSIVNDAAVRKVAELVPLNHLMIESDGLDALSWCENRKVTMNGYRELLIRSIKEIAKIKHVSFTTAQNQLNQTFHHFLDLTKSIRK